ncbi:O-methyltransferase-domain-containing protein [Hysterangium stoloniferum]|nr:O-methyltransferase-domain-containing protein [Hysterangium stoloniferum]
MTSPMNQLTDLLVASVKRIEGVCAARGVDFPSLEDPFTPESEQIRADPVISEASSTLLAAALHLVALVRPPSITIATAGTSYYLSAALRVAIEANVPEILRTAGPEGLHTKQISEKNGIDSGKLARILRFLCTHHIFRELSPDVFTNNRLSSLVDTMKAPDEILKNPLEKYDGTTGMAALVTHCADEDAKGAAYIWETLSDQTTAHSEEPNASPMCRAFNTDKTIWSWFEESHNALRLRRFGVAMAGVNSTQSENSLLQDFDWGSLTPGSIVVDVGGGIGVSCLVLARAFPHLKFVIQDRAPVLENAYKVCIICLKAISCGQVIFQTHDFFTEQPVKNAAVFILKQILHDWSDKYAQQIVARLREASTSMTSLVVVDHMTPYSCAVAGDNEVYPPAPLLANMGPANPMPYVTDLSMLVHFNSQERTKEHIFDLLKSSGWEAITLSRDLVAGPEYYLPKVIARPLM